MTALWQGRPAPRIAHSWRCTQRGPYTEQTVTEPTGQAVIVTRCEECNGTDQTRPAQHTGSQP